MEIPDIPIMYVQWMNAVSQTENLKQWSEHSGFLGIILKSAKEMLPLLVIL